MIDPLFSFLGPNNLNETLNKRINDGGKIHITPSKVGPTYILRFAVCSRLVNYLWIYYLFQSLFERSLIILLNLNIIILLPLGLLKAMILSLHGQKYQS